MTDRKALWRYTFCFLDFCCLRVAHAVRSLEISFGATEVEVHIQADRKVILVVGNIESNDILFLSVFLFNEGEDEATVFGIGIFHFEFLLASVDDELFLTTFAVGHDESDAVAFLIISGIEGACTHHHAQHVEGTAVALELVGSGRILVALVEHVDLA